MFAALNVLSWLCRNLKSDINCGCNRLNLFVNLKDMKRIFSLCLITFFALSINSCKDDTPTPEPEQTDLRDNVTGEFDGELNVYNAKTGAFKKKYTLDLKVQNHTKEIDKFNFWLDGLYLFMTAENLRKISVGYGFDIPEQEVKNFGILKGKNYINVDGDNQRYTGIYYPDQNKYIIYMEKDNGGTSDDDLYEFFISRK